MPKELWSRTAPGCRSFRPRNRTTPKRRMKQDEYVALASQGKKYLKQQTISGLEASLDPKVFVRIHRSYLMNLERVSRLEPYAERYSRRDTQ